MGLNPCCFCFDAGPPNDLPYDLKTPSFSPYFPISEQLAGCLFVGCLFVAFSHTHTRPHGSAMSESLSRNPAARIPSLQHMDKKAKLEFIRLFIRSAQGVKESGFFYLLHISVDTCLGSDLVLPVNVLKTGVRRRYLGTVWHCLLDPFSFIHSRQQDTNKPPIYISKKKRSCAVFIAQAFARSDEEDRSFGRTTSLLPQVFIVLSSCSFLS